MKFLDHALVCTPVSSQMLRDRAYPAVLIADWEAFKAGHLKQKRVLLSRACTKPPMMLQETGEKRGAFTDVASSLDDSPDGHVGSDPPRKAAT